MPQQAGRPVAGEAARALPNRPQRGDLRLSEESKGTTPATCAYVYLATTTPAITWCCYIQPSECRCCS
jgi:hypothetical protein